MLEKDIEQELVRCSKKNGCLIFKFLSTERGVPDRIVIYQGHVCFVEMKNGDAGHLSGAQKWQLQRLRQAGAQVRVLRTKDEVHAFVEDFVTGKDGDDQLALPSV